MRQIFQRQDGQRAHSRSIAFNFSNKAIAAPGESFNKAGGLGGVAQGFPQPLDGVVKTVVEIDKGVGGPDLLLQFFAGDGLTGTLQKNLEDLERLLLEFDLRALFPQFAGPEIQFKGPETNYPA